MFDKNSLLSR